MTLTRRSVLAAVSAAAAAQAQRRYPNWKPRLSVLCQYTDSDLEFIKAEGFTSMQLRLDPARLDDATREKENLHTIACLACRKTILPPFKRLAGRRRDKFVPFLSYFER